jgi:hypothetical protein
VHQLKSPVHIESWQNKPIVASELRDKSFPTAEEQKKFKKEEPHPYFNHQQNQINDGQYTHVNEVEEKSARLGRKCPKSKYD